MSSEIDNELEKCFKGNHNLIEIYRQIIDESEENVVMWCKLCGSVVIDGEYDGTIYPGKILKMLSPQTINLIKVIDD